MSWKKELRTEIKKWRELQDKYVEFGAGDTEPDYHFEDIIRCAYQGRPFPITKWRQWELFSSMEGSRAAANDLTKQAKKVYRLVKLNTLRPNELGLWRVDLSWEG